MSTAPLPPELRELADAIAHGVVAALQPRLAELTTTLKPVRDCGPLPSSASSRKPAQPDIATACPPARPTAPPRPAPVVWPMSLRRAHAPAPLNRPPRLVVTARRGAVGSKRIRVGYAG